MSNVLVWKGGGNLIAGGSWAAGRQALHEHVMVVVRGVFAVGQQHANPNMPSDSPKTCKEERKVNNCRDEEQWKQ